MVLLLLLFLSQRAVFSDVCSWCKARSAIGLNGKAGWKRPGIERRCSEEMPKYTLFFYSHASGTKGNQEVWQLQRRLLAGIQIEFTPWRELTCTSKTLLSTWKLTVPLNWDFGQNTISHLIPLSHRVQCFREHFLFTKKEIYFGGDVLSLAEIFWKVKRQ